MQMAEQTEINKSTKNIRISIINHLTYNHSLQHFQFEDLFEKVLHLYKKILGRLKHGLNLMSMTTFQFSGVFIFLLISFLLIFFPFFFSLCLLLSTRSYSVDSTQQLNLRLRIQIKVQLWPLLIKNDSQVQQNYRRNLHTTKFINFKIILQCQKQLNHSENDF